MEDGSGGRNSITLGGILSIKQTPPYRIQARTLLDLIRDDQTCGKESKNTWKMFREKFRLRLAGSVCTTTASQVHITTDSNRTTTRNGATRSISPPVDNTGSVADTLSESVQIEPTVMEEGRGVGDEGGEPAAVRMSLMSLLEVEGSAYVDGDGNDEEEVELEEEEASTAVMVVEDGGGDGGGGEYKYNNCCVCMVRHKGAAFIPCGHTFCRLCSRELFVKRASCPLCNNFILEILDIF